MISKLPWRLDEDGMIIYDADGEVVAEDYKFNHVDDYEAICNLIKTGTRGNLPDGGFCLPESESKRILATIFIINKEIQKAVDGFTERELPGLRKEYEGLINDGVSREEAFNIIRAKI